MRLHTTSETISFAKELETKSAEFYNDLSMKYAKDQDIFGTFAEENKKNIVQSERTYYGVISDAIEGCFAFDIEPEMYKFAIKLPENGSYSDAINGAVEIEQKMAKFYSDAAQQSKSLMADIPRVFAMIAKKRDTRISRLSSLLKDESSQ